MTFGVWQRSLDAGLFMFNLLLAEYSILRILLFQYWGVK